MQDEGLHNLWWQKVQEQEVRLVSYALIVTSGTTEHCLFFSVAYA